MDPVTKMASALLVFFLSKVIQALGNGVEAPMDISILSRITHTIYRPTTYIQPAGEAQWLSMRLQLIRDDYDKHRRVAGSIPALCYFFSSFPFRVFHFFLRVPESLQERSKRIKSELCP